MPKRKAARSPTPVSDSSDDPDRVYVVEQVLDHGLAEADEGMYLFKIRWKGYGPHRDTWEPIEMFDPPLDILSGYIHRFPKLRKFYAGTEFGQPVKKRKVKRKTVSPKAKANGFLKAEPPDTLDGDSAGSDVPLAKQRRGSGAAGRSAHANGQAATPARTTSASSALQPPSRSQSTSEPDQRRSVSAAATSARSGTPRDEYGVRIPKVEEDDNEEVMRIETEPVTRPLQPLPSANAPPSQLAPTKKARAKPKPAARLPSVPIVTSDANASAATAVQAERPINTAKPATSTVIEQLSREPTPTVVVSAPESIAPTPPTPLQPEPIFEQQPPTSARSIPTTPVTPHSGFDETRNSLERLEDHLRGSVFIPPRTPYGPSAQLSKVIGRVLHGDDQQPAAAPTIADLVEPFLAAYGQRVYSVIITPSSAPSHFASSAQRRAEIELDVFALSYLLLAAGVKQRLEVLPPSEELAGPIPMVFVHESEVHRIAEHRELDEARKESGPIVIFGRGKGTRMLYGDGIAVAICSSVLIEQPSIIYSVVDKPSCLPWCHPGLITTGAVLDIDAHFTDRRKPAQVQILYQLTGADGTRFPILDPQPTTSASATPLFPRPDDSLRLDLVKYQPPLPADPKAELDVLLGVARDYFARYTHIRRWFIVAPDEVAALDEIQDLKGPIEVYAFSEFEDFL